MTAETVAVPSKRSQKRKQVWLRTLIEWHNKQARANTRALSDPDLRFEERMNLLQAGEYHHRTVAFLRELQQ